MQIRSSLGQGMSPDSLDSIDMPQGLPQNIQSQLEDMMRRLAHMLSQSGNHDASSVGSLDRCASTPSFSPSRPASYQMDTSQYGNNANSGYDSGYDSDSDVGGDDSGDDFQSQMQSEIDNDLSGNGDLDNSGDDVDTGGDDLDTGDDAGYDSGYESADDDDDDITPEVKPPEAQPAQPTQTGSSSPTTGAFSGEAQTSALSPDQSKAMAQQWVSHLQQDLGISESQAKGIVANLWHESGGMNSGINQGGQIGAPSSNNADDNANGYGIAQWGGVRKEGLINYANEHGIDPSSQAANYGYLVQELRGSQSSALSAVKGTSSPEEATKAFCDAFEKPSDPQLQSRLNILSEMA